MLFWKIVKKEVERQKTSYGYLYRKTGIPKGTFSAWKSRKIMPRADEALAIAHALEVSLDYLLTGAEPKKRPSNPKIREIVERIGLLDERDLKAVSALVNCLTDDK
ncbi:MAG: helix-turn-helix domain containing protein [Treponema sp.]|nr:helix-turn-helix domain containing protein [Treponema sp.]